MSSYVQYEKYNEILAINWDTLSQARKDRLSTITKLLRSIYNSEKQKLEDIEKIFQLENINYSLNDLYQYIGNTIKVEDENLDLVVNTGINPTKNNIQRTERAFNLTNIADFMKTSAPNCLFAFDFDDTLVSNVGNLWMNGYLEFDVSQLDKAKDIVYFPGIERILQEALNHKTIIVTFRDENGVLKVRDILRSFGNIYEQAIQVLGTRDRKGSIIFEYLRNHPQYDTVYFIDDSDRFIEDVEEYFSNHTLSDRIINLVTIPGLGSKTYNPNLSPDIVQRNSLKYNQYLFRDNV
ncbi:Hypothetical protein HVR_LOCUS950 [uncultured virus]|nr:Hypothetical protein HVR_LOCUS950 [uncultured virus]